jgi:hypothetical protein
MSFPIEKTLGHLLSDKAANQKRSALALDTDYIISHSSFAPGSVGRFDLTPDQTSGGGPFSATVTQGGKVVQQTTDAVGGSILSCTIGETIGHLPCIDQVSAILRLTKAKPQARFFGNYDGK